QGEPCRLVSDCSCTLFLLARPSLFSAGMTTILIVDDEPPILDLVRFTLEDADVRVVEASDGAEALLVARREKPDLILLDVQMPKLTGLEVCRQLRGEAAFARIPIVMLTAATQEADRARGREAGADEYLTKPFSPLALLALVEPLVPETRSWRPPSRCPRRWPTRAISGTCTRSPGRARRRSPVRTTSCGLPISNRSRMRLT